MDPSRRDGVIGSDRRATIRKTTNRGQGSDRALRDGFLIGPVPGNKLPGYHHSVPTGRGQAELVLPILRKCRFELVFA
jgi:hypothetical protein